VALVGASAALLAGAMGVAATLLPSDNYAGNTEADRSQAYDNLQHKIEAASASKPDMKTVLPVLLVVESVDPGTRTMNVAVTMNLNATASGLVDEKTKRPVADGGAGTILRLRVDDSDIAIPLGRLDPDPWETRTPDSWPTAARGAVRLQGNPEDFPEDQYGVFGNAVLDTPDALTYRIGPAKFSKRVPIAVGFGIDQDQKRWVVSEVDEQLGRDGPFEAHVGTGLWRTRDQVYLVYSVALAPLLIALIATVLWAVRGRDMQATVPTVELGVAFLAVLPLRSVLVPSSIPEMTELDKLLALQMILVVAGSACAVAFAILRRRTSSPDQSIDA
jgi:hypothetical protein